jgi:transcriptional regulator with XRE-family HTH domain
VRVNIGDRIRTARKAAKLSQEDVARRAGLSLKGMGDIERGDIEDPHFSSLVKIAGALGVPVEELIRGEQPVPLGKAPGDAGPRQVTREELIAEGIPATDHEVEEANNLIMVYWRLGQGEKAVSHFSHEDVDQNRVWMLIHLILGTPSIITPEDAGVVRQGMREKLRA